MRDPDEAVVAMFLSSAVKNEAKSAAAGRPIFDDMEVCQLRYPGSKNVGVYPATGFSHWAIDPYSGEQVKVTYAERFARQYRQFKEHSTQTKVGTPLTEVSFLTEARRAELRALNIYTVEALAAIDGLELKNLGFNGRELKNRAIEYIEEARAKAPGTQMAAELEALRARNALLEEDVTRLKEYLPPPPDPQAAGEDFEGMSLQQLRDYIAANSGRAPEGAVNRRTLIRMARDLTTTEPAG
jgi:hypothetical protein